MARSPWDRPRPSTSETLDVSQGVLQNLVLDGGSIIGGTVVTGAGGGLTVINTGTIQGTQINNAGALTVNGDTTGSATLILTATGVGNSGTLALVGTSASNFAALDLAADTTLQGGGQVTLSDNGNSSIRSSNGAVTLTNVDNTLSGGGVIGDSNITLHNDSSGTIDANVSGQTLAVDAAAFTNEGTAEATNGGDLFIANALDGAGTVSLGNGSRVELGGSVSASESVAFADANGNVLKIDDPLDFKAPISNLQIGDSIDLANTLVSTATLAGSTLTVVTKSNQTLTFTVSGALAGNSFQIKSDGVGGTNLVLSPIQVSSWGSFEFPAAPTTGVHLLRAGINFNLTNDLVTLSYNTTTNYDPVNDPTGPYPVTGSVLPLDPFFLASQPATTIDSVSVNLPEPTHVLLPNISTPNGVRAEGIDFYEDQDNSGNNIIDQAVITGGGGGALNVATTIGLEDAGTSTIYSIDGSGRQDSNTTPPTLTTYGLGWDQYDAGSQSYSLRFQIFNADGTASSSVITPVITSSNATSVTVAATSLPAWHFRGGSGAYELAVPESSTTASANLNLTGQAYQQLQFQTYNLDGSKGASSFVIRPNLNGYAAGASNQIIQDNTGLSPFPRNTDQLDFFQLSGANNNAYVVAWNETVTDSSGTHDQVEFVVRTGSAGVVYRQTFKIASGNAQKVSVDSFADPNVPGQENIVLAYGDGTATHLNEFSVRTTVVNGTPTTQVTPGLALVDPTTVSFSGGIHSLGDGRVEVGYNQVIDANETSQATFKIFDFRQAGININDSGLTDGQDKDVAGSQFDDSFAGENNVNNNYYYVGQDTTGQGPSDAFNGGAFGWNTAIFPDAEANYTIQTANGTTTVTNVGDPLHAGTLTADSDVEALAFGPSKDPSPGNNALEVTGTSVLLQDFPGTVGIDDGATLELTNGASGNNQSVAFNGSTGDLVLDASALFGSGQLTVSGFTGQGAIDFKDISAASATLGYSPNSDNSGGTLSVGDGSNTALIALIGQYSAASFALASDGHGGTLLSDPPLGQDPLVKPPG
jgi:hypothetical protein